jgi:carbamoylphosphate synthase small subunit
MKTNPDGIFLSNGPGDPFATGEKVIPVINKLIKKRNSNIWYLFGSSNFKFGTRS